MNIPLDCFEQYIDETILKRGLSYFKNGHVEEVTETSPHCFEAVVRGTDDYNVALRIEGGALKSAACDCPYEDDICKHVVAVIFYLQQDVLDISPSQKKDAKKSAVGKRVKAPAKNEVESILSQISSKDLEQFIRVKSKADRQFKLDFLSYFAFLTDNAKEVYQKQIKAFMRGIKRLDYVNASNARRIEKFADGLLNQAESFVEEGQFERGMMICQTILEEMADALNDVYGGTETISDCASAAIELLKKIVGSSSLPDRLKTELFDYCITNSSKKDWWDLDVELIDLASKLISSSEEEQKLFQVIDNNYSKKSFKYERLQSIKLSVIQQTQGEDAAKRYMRANVALPAFRSKFIEEAIAEKNYAEAATLAKQAVEQGKKDSPDELKQWYAALLQIASLQKDDAKITEYARWLLLHDDRNRETYYDMLKQNVAAAEWKPFIDGVIAESSGGTQRAFNFTSLIGFIYIKENRIDELYKATLLLDPEPEFLLERYDKYLLPKYAEEVVKMYREMMEYMINDYMVNRSAYRRVTYYLKHMNAIGLKPYADVIIEEFRKKYPKRPAFMDELNKV